MGTLIKVTAISLGGFAAAFAALLAFQKMGLTQNNPILSLVDLAHEVYKAFNTHPSR